MYKNKSLLLASLVSACVLASILATGTACHSVQTVDPVTGVTNTVREIDPQKLEVVKAAMNTVSSAVFTQEIKNSPNHAAEISAYVRAVGATFCAAKATKQFSPATLFPALEAATAPLQANVSPAIIISKNGLKLLYQSLFNDKLTVQLADNKWPAAVVDVICTAVDQSLKDAGQPGLQ